MYLPECINGHNSTCDQYLIQHTQGYQSIPKTHFFLKIPNGPFSHSRSQLLYTRSSSWNQDRVDVAHFEQLSYITNKTSSIKLRICIRLCRVQGLLVLEVAREKAFFLHPALDLKIHPIVKIVKQNNMNTYSNALSRNCLQKLFPKNQTDTPFILV